MLCNLSHVLGRLSDGLEELWGYRDLALPGWVIVLQGSQEIFYGFDESSGPVLVSRDVQRDGPLMLPKRRSQVACGTSDSRRSHWFLTDPNTSPLSVEGPLPQVNEKSLEEERLFPCGYSKEAGVISTVSLGKVGPPFEDPLHAFVGPFLFRVQDDSMVCSTAQTKEAISMGRGCMENPAGTSWG